MAVRMRSTASVIERPVGLLLIGAHREVVGPLFGEQTCVASDAASAACAEMV